MDSHPRGWRRLQSGALRGRFRASKLLVTAVQLDVVLRLEAGAHRAEAHIREEVEAHRALQAQPTTNSTAAATSIPTTRSEAQATCSMVSSPVKQAAQRQMHASWLTHTRAPIMYLLPPGRLHQLLPLSMKTEQEGTHMSVGVLPRCCSSWMRNLVDATLGEKQQHTSHPRQRAGQLLSPIFPEHGHIPAQHSYRLRSLCSALRMSMVAHSVHSRHLSRQRLLHLPFPQLEACAG